MILVFNYKMSSCGLCVVNIFGSYFYGVGGGVLRREFLGCLF